MNKPYRKLSYDVGADYTIGTPTQQRTGLGKIVTIIGFTEDGRRVIIVDKANPTRTAKVKFSNVGRPIAPDGTYVDDLENRGTATKSAVFALGECISC
jgi:hypothetical protein